MTVQCAILNPRCEIFASDTGVTTPDGKKYDGVQKIFKLTDIHPAKIMINGNMEFENIPMITIIDEFKKKTNFNKLKSIEEIKNEFIKFIRKYAPYSNSEEYISHIVINFKEMIKDEINEYRFERTISTKNRIEIYPFIENYSNFKNEFKDIIPKNKDIKKYNKLIWEIFCYNLKYEGTGVIFAGYDINSPYPSFIEINLHCNDEKCIIYEEIESNSNFEETIIRIYAMNDEGYAFFTGVNEEFTEYITNYILETNEEILQKFKSKLEKEDISKKDKVLKFLSALFDEEYSDLNIMINFFRVDVLDNTSKSIEFIPNNLLCTLADEIIRLTGIKQKISSEDEHVSITSHISLITKLNGFQWFKFDDKIL